VFWRTPQPSEVVSQVGPSSRGTAPIGRFRRSAANCAIAASKMITLLRNVKAVRCNLWTRCLLARMFFPGSPKRRDTITRSASTRWGYKHTLTFPSRQSYSNTEAQAYCTCPSSVYSNPITSCHPHG
jgi:hypothetical protein